MTEEMVMLELVKSMNIDGGYMTYKNVPKLAQNQLRQLQELGYFKFNKEAEAK